MTQSRLEKIKERLENATYGNWQVYDTDEGRCIGTEDENPQLNAPYPVVTMSTWSKEPRKRIMISQEDAEFIAHSKKDIGWLIRQAEKVEEMEQRLKEHNLPVDPCYVCKKEERNPGLDVCGTCYGKQIRS